MTKPHLVVVTAATTLTVLVALSPTLTRPATAGPPGGGITAAKVKVIARAQVRKAAPGLSVKDARTLAGRSLARVKPVVAGAQNDTIVGSLAGGADLVSLTYTLPAPSDVSYTGTVQLEGDGGLGDEAQCFILQDGILLSLGYETSFDDVGTVSAVTSSVVTFTPAVPAGQHVVVLSCAQSDGTGVVAKDDAAINIVAVPR